MRLPIGRRGLAPLLACTLALVYVAFALVHARFVNTDAGRHDQSTYLWCVRVLYETRFDAPTNRSQMPGYLYLQALLYPNGVITDAQLFVHAQRVSIALSLGLVGALCVFFHRTLPTLEARVAMLVTAFTLFVFRASYVQAELLFYTVSFFGFVALCRLWARPSIGIALVAGLLEALAFLCKGSVQPGLALFAVLFLARAGCGLRQRRDGLASRAFVARIVELGVLAGSFLAPLVPYLAKSKEMYGSYFFNVNTRYVMWCDSWDDFLAYEDRLGKWWTWGSLPAASLPSMGSYLHTHAIATIAAREILGVLEVVGNLVLGTGYFEFLALYLGFAAVAFGFTRSPTRAFRAIDPRSPVAFAVPYVLVYLAIFGFYAPIAAGARFSLMTFLPALYTLLRAGAAAAPSATFGTRTVTWRQLNVAMLVLVVLHVVFVLPITIGRIYAGG